MYVCVCTLNYINILCICMGLDMGKVRYDEMVMKFRLSGEQVGIKRNMMYM